jgi:hypothetical protein
LCPKVSERNLSIKNTSRTFNNEKMNFTKCFKRKEFLGRFEFKNVFVSILYPIVGVVDVEQTTFAKFLSLSMSKIPFFVVAKRWRD